MSDKLFWQISYLLTLFVYLSNGAPFARDNAEHTASDAVERLNKTTFEDKNNGSEG